MYNACMAVALQIRNVPDDVRDALVERASQLWSVDAGVPVGYGKYLSLGGHVDDGEDILTCAPAERSRKSPGSPLADLTLRGTVLWTGFGAKRLDYLCFIFRADRSTGTPHDGNGEGTLEWAPLNNLTGLPMWDSDHQWLPVVFDESPKPFHGVLPYGGHKMIRWSFQR